MVCARMYNGILTEEEKNCKQIFMSSPSLSMMLTVAVEPPTIMMKLWSPSRAMLSSTTRSVKSIHPRELSGPTVMVAPVPKSPATSKKVLAF